MLFVLAGCTERLKDRSKEAVLFNDGWEFVIADDSAGIFKSPEVFAWQQVSLPHTPVIEPLVVNNQWQGICWYRKTFHLPKNSSGKVLFLKFEGAMNVADVWVNGEKMIHHLGGYLPFTIDFTAVAKPGQDNLVMVRLDNTDNPVTGPKPLKHLDFNTYGGIYRDVFLILKNAVHITDPLLEGVAGGGGIFVAYPEASPGRATISVKTHVKNDDTSQRTFFVHHELWKEKELVAEVSSGERTLAPGTSVDDVAEISLTSPRLWSPADPNRYKLVTTVVSGNEIEDRETNRIGIRRFEITKDRFALNGEELFLRGVNRHQEYPYIGYAVGNEAQYRDAVKIKEAGFDYVRLSHYPHSPAFMDACDELGLLVLDAIPGWQYYSEDPAFQEQVVSTCRDMIRRDRNHPCVLAWEVSLNESWMQENFIDRLVSATREEYPGNQCFTAGWMEYGYDIYLQARQHRLEWYRDPGKPYMVSEYGDWEYYAMNAGFNQDSWGDLLQEDRSSRQLRSSGEVRLLQQATNVQEAHNDNFTTPAFADGYWVMFDYNRGYTDDLEASGIMSIERLPKFSYFFFRSQRDPDEVSSLHSSGPMVFIASYWDEHSPADVRVYSNCEEVDLLLDGELLARQKPDTGRISDHLNHPPFTFGLKQFQPGTLEAIGFIGGKEAARHTVRTPEKLSGLVLVIDESGKGPQAGCNDFIFVYARLVDIHGTVVPVNGIPVKFSVRGGAEFIGGDIRESQAGIACALLKIGEKPGRIEIKAESESLISGAMVFHSSDTR